MSSTPRGFVTGGTWCLDRNITLPYWPGEDLYAPVLDLQTSGGGSACNFAVDLRRLDPGLPVSTIGLVGDDAEGQQLLAVAQREGIEHRRLQRLRGQRSQATDAYQSQASGRRTHILHEGTAGLLTPDHFDFERHEARYLHLGLPGLHRLMDRPWEGDANGWVTVLRHARAAGLRTNLELVTVPPQRLRELVLPCLPHLDTLVVNDHEIGALAGMTTVEDGHTLEDACVQAARYALEQGAMALVVVHFVGGAWALTREGESIRKSSVRVPPEEYRGANGAGDAFAAGLFLGLSRDWPLAQCLRMAHATAAACLRSTTPSESVEKAETCLALADAWGWRD